MGSSMDIEYHMLASGHRIAFQYQPGEGVGIMFCGGYRSDMESGKATALAAWCAERRVPFTRFDYFAHGASEGEFMDFTIGSAIDSALAILDHAAAAELVLVGSSMGGWVGLQAALQRPLQVQAFVGIAAAPDFSERLMVPQFNSLQRAQLESDGFFYAADFEDNTYPITQHFIAEARRHLLLEHPIPLSIPVRLLQGQQDAEVPWQTALDIAAALTGDDVQVTLVKDGDHRLNRPQDMALLLNTVAALRA